METLVTPDFWREKRVFITGHTGFKGAWLAYILRNFGARVFGYALAPSTRPSLFELLRLDEVIESTLGDVRNRDAVETALRAAAPDVVFHLAAQPLVRESFRDPSTTFDTNVMGVVHVIEAVRVIRSEPLILAVTTDKVYEDSDSERPHVESDRLGGLDPYSASKACAELVSASYRSSVLVDGRPLRLATARAGNVIGGGDWSDDRIVPDIVRAVVSEKDVFLRHPNATRPWQHVLEPLSGYLTLVEAMAKRGPEVDTAWNFGPNPAVSSPPVAALTEQFIAAFHAPVRWVHDGHIQPPERRLLQIDSTRANRELGWRPRLSMQETIEWTTQWYSAWRERRDLREFTSRQVTEYFERGTK